MEKGTIPVHGDFKFYLHILMEQIEFGTECWYAVWDSIQFPHFLLVNLGRLGFFFENNFYPEKSNTNHIGSLILFNNPLLIAFYRPFIETWL